VKNEYGWSIIFGACRFIVGMVCLASALGKSMDFQGFVEVLSTYRFFPDWGLWPVAIGITSLEWVLALWLLSGWRIGSSALVALILYGLYASSLVITLLRGLDLPNCGCYGVFFPQPLRWYSPLEDLVLVGMCYAVWLSARKAGRPIDTSF
jgi:Methylamine utilisation protein MauE